MQLGLVNGEDDFHKAFSCSFVVLKDRRVFDEGVNGRFTINVAFDYFINDYFVISTYF